MPCVRGYPALQAVANVCARFTKALRPYHIQDLLVYMSQGTHNTHLPVAQVERTVTFK